MARKRLPHGMTPNMVKIMEASRLAREQGLKTYGRFVAHGDTSAIDVKQAKGKPERVCQRCGADISHRNGGTKYCHACAGDVNRERNRAKYHETHPPKMINCTDCGVLVQVKSGTHKVCPDCAAKRRKASRQAYAQKRRERLKAEKQTHG